MRILWVEDDPEISKKTYFGSSILDFHDLRPRAEIELSQAHF